MKYRREIDGLRAVAVIPVILFHAGWTVFSGGYVGVDVFFVISGYLITKIILTELAEGRFSILKFYERRTRRILPALFCVILCCLPFAWAWMVPLQFRDFAQSLVAVGFFASNILFWRESGYFEAAAEEKPLLHTWSLAVEEQYYLFLPLLLILLWRFGRAPVFYTILALSIVSLLASEWSWRLAHTANFYLLPTRAWELLTGSLCAFVQVGKPQKSNNILASFGLGLIILAIFGYDEHTPFPSVYALAPVTGTALIILYGAHDTLVARLLSLRVFVGIGLISYSAYLWHQPLFAFARIKSIYPPEQWLMMTLAAAALMLAALSWRYVEQPFRQGPNRLLPTKRAIFGASGAGTAVMLGIGLTGHLGHLDALRFTPDQLAYLNHFRNDLPTPGYFQREGIEEKFRHSCNFNTPQSALPVAEIPADCYTRDPQQAQSVFLWGDSHAQMLHHGLRQSLPESWQVLQVASFACAARIVTAQDKSDYCAYSNWFALQAIADSAPDVVVVAQNLGQNTADMDILADKLHDLGIPKVIFTGPSPHWVGGLPKIVAMDLGLPPPQRSLVGVNKPVLTLDERLKREFEASDRKQYVSLIDVFCSAEGCLTYLGDDPRTGATSWDYGHLTPQASHYLAEQVLAGVIQE